MTPAEELFVRFRNALSQNDFESARRLLSSVRADRSEREWVDWKRANALQGASLRLHDDDKKNFARLLSAFANSAGGLIVWGVDDDGTERPLENPREFVRTLLDTVNTLTLPPITGVDALVVPQADIDGAGFVIVVVPRSYAGPHQVWGKVPDNGRFLVRSGTNCEMLDAYRLEDMFGRRPQAMLDSVRRVEIEYHTHGSNQRQNTAGKLRFRLENRGMVQAHDLFASIRVPLNIDDATGNNVKFNASFEVQHRGARYGEEAEAGAMKRVDFIESIRLSPGHHLDSFIQVRFRFSFQTGGASFTREALTRAVQQAAIPPLQIRIGCDAGRPHDILAHWWEVFEKHLPEANDVL